MRDLKQFVRHEDLEERSLERALRALGELAAQRRQERSETEEKLFHLEQERRCLRQELAEARQRSSALTSLYVATHRLHASLDRNEVVLALEEIVASLIGCEEMAVFELIGRPPVLAPVASVGLPAGAVGVIAPGAGIVGQVATSGELWVAHAGVSPDPTERPLTACIPLKVDGNVTGVIALYRLLEHKQAIEENDHELFELLSLHAGTALYATRLHSGATRQIQ